MPEDTATTTTSETIAADTTTATDTTTSETAPLLGTPPEKAAGTIDTTKKDEVQPPKKDAKPTGVPEKYDFVVPEGMALDEAALGKFEPIARELGLSQEHANKLVALYAEQMGEGQKAHDAAWAKTQGDWKTSVATDKEFGGAALEATIRDANLALTKFAVPEDVAELQRLGLGNCPPLVKLLARAGKLMGEDKMFNTNGTAMENTEAARAARMFPSSK